MNRSAADSSLQVCKKYMYTKSTKAGDNLGGVVDYNILYVCFCINEAV